LALTGDDALEALGLTPEPGDARQLNGGVVFCDPRDARLGARAILPAKDTAVLTEKGFAAGEASNYERLRLSLGVPDGSRDMMVERSTLLENDFERLHGVDFEKGCYVGQELTARTKYRGLIKKRLMPVEVSGPLPPPGTPIMLGDKEAGEIRSGYDGQAIALLRLERIEQAHEAGEVFRAGDAVVTPGDSA
jgi:folate-binding protein YgfZ